MRGEQYGTLPDGRAVEAFTIAGGRLTATVLTLGATLADLVVETAAGPRSVVLGFATAADWWTQTAYMGCVAGRCANRIRDGRFTLDGVDFRLGLNDGPNHLHGGVEGFNRKLWTAVDASERSVTLTLVSPDGEEGYPGKVEATCSYAIDAAGDLVIGLEATTERPTLVNLATHSYFALDDAPTILDHRLRVLSERYTPVDETLIPTGEIAEVAGTRFDFRAERPIRNGGDDDHVGTDHNFACYAAPAATPRPMARLSSPTSGLALEVLSTEPGLQVYDGGFLPVPEPLRGDRPGRRFGGICLEPQRFPDAIHHAHFPGSVLRPGETYRQTTVYRLMGG